MADQAMPVSRRAGIALDLDGGGRFSWQKQCRLTTRPGIATVSDLES
jgi:hypothetical protein